MRLNTYGYESNKTAIVVSRGNINKAAKSRDTSKGPKSPGYDIYYRKLYYRKLY